MMKFGNADMADLIDALICLLEVLIFAAFVGPFHPISLIKQQHMH